jgi:hypothetical protein
MGTFLVMRNIVLLLLAVPLCALAQRSPSCDSAPAASQVVVPQELRKWVAIECGEGGHAVTPAAGYAWRGNTNGAPVRFPAAGPGGTPVNPAKSGAYFEKSRIFPIEGDFLVGSNEIASKEKGYAGPYRKGYLYDLLSNQGFQYRLFVLLVDNEPHMVNVVFQTEDRQRKLTFLVTRQ